MHRLKVAIIGKDKHFMSTIEGHFKEILIFEEWVEPNTIEDYYDILIISFIILRHNGFCALEKMRESNTKKHILVLMSGEWEPYFHKHICPINYIKNNITILELNNILKYKLFTSEYIDEIFKKLGIPSHIKGYIYLKELVNVFNLDVLNKDMYLKIANKFNTKAINVERSIRHAIEISWTRSDYRFVNDLFGNTLRHDKERPTNKEYISALICFLKSTVH